MNFQGKLRYFTFLPTIKLNRRSTSCLNAVLSKIDCCILNGLIFGFAFHFPPFSIFFILFAGPQQHTPRNPYCDCLDELYQLVALQGVNMKAQAVLIGSYPPFLISITWGGLGRVLANFLLFRSSPLIRRESDCRSSRRCFTQLFSFRFFVCWIGSTRSYKHRSIRCPVYAQFSPFPFFGATQLQDLQQGRSSPSSWHAAHIDTLKKRVQARYTSRGKVR